MGSFAADRGAERMRQAIERAHAGGAAPRALTILAGVLYWTVGHSKVSDYVSLGKIAQAAGMWAGRSMDCPRPITNEVRKGLRQLVESGCIDYEPAKGRGTVGRVELMPVVEGDVLNRRNDEGSIELRRELYPAPGKAGRSHALSSDRDDGKAGNVHALSPKKGGEIPSKRQGNRLEKAGRNPAHTMVSEVYRGKPIVTRAFRRPTGPPIDVRRSRPSPPPIRRPSR